MTPEFMNLLAAYFLCNATAELRMLEAYEAQQCLAWQTAIKVELLPDVSPESYEALTLTERADVGRRGYQAYLAWKVQNPELVADLEAQARAVARHQSGS